MHPTEGFTLTALRRKLQLDTGTGAYRIGPDGRYELISHIGKGGFSDVFLAYDRFLHRQVAAKVIGGKHKRKRIYPRQALREARYLASLHHPNVIDVYDFIETPSSFTIVTEYIDGTNLLDWLQAASRGRSEILDQFIAAGRGLAACHNIGLIHRDFKPSNVLVSKTGRVLVVDFGLGAVVESESESGGIGDPESGGIGDPLHDSGNVDDPLHSLSHHGGTFRYMSPQQLLQNRASALDDQFSFGVSLWEALSHFHPFIAKLQPDAEHWSFLLEAIRRGPVYGAPRIPRAIRRVLKRAMSYDPNDRFSSMDEMLRNLEGARNRTKIVRGSLALATAMMLMAILPELIMTDLDTGSGGDLTDFASGEDVRPGVLTAVTFIGGVVFGVALSAIAMLCRRFADRL